MRLLQKRGIVAKIIGNRCIVLSSEGTYARIPLPSAEVKVGTEIFYRNFEVPKSKPMMLVASLLILFMSYYLVDQALIPQQAVAYVSLDIDPSLEMSVDKNMRVIKVECFNDEAVNLVQSMDLEGKGLDKAITQVINGAVDQDYIKADRDNLLISTITSCQENVTVNKNDLCLVMEQSIESRGYSGEVRVYATEEDIHAAAQKKGISAGKYVICEQIVQSGYDVSMDNVNHQTVSQLTGSYKLALSPNFDELTMESVQANRTKKNTDEKEILKPDYKEDRSSISSKLEEIDNRQINNVSRSYPERKNRVAPNRTAEIVEDKDTTPIKSVTEVLGLKKKGKTTSYSSKFISEGRDSKKKK